MSRWLGLFVAGGGRATYRCVYPDVAIRCNLASAVLSLEIGIVQPRVGRGASPPRSAVERREPVHGPPLAMLSHQHRQGPPAIRRERGTEGGGTSDPDVPRRIDVRLQALVAPQAGEPIPGGAVAFVDIAAARAGLAGIGSPVSMLTMPNSCSSATSFFCTVDRPQFCSMRFILALRPGMRKSSFSRLSAPGRWTVTRLLNTRFTSVVMKPLTRRTNPLYRSFCRGR